MTLLRSSSDLDALFRPRSVAVVGASKDAAKLGHVLLRNVLDYGFAGEVYPVNPSGGEILGRTVYADLKSTPTVPDLVLLSIPNRAVPAAIRDAAARGARAAVILSSGFGEMGGDGASLQAEVKSSGLRILGPNCMGIYRLPDRLNGTYFWELPRRAGNLAFVSQSGAYGGMLFGELRRRSMGLSTFVSIGNQADITHADVMEFLEEDPATEVVALFVEEIRNGHRFLATARRLAAKKAVVAFKVGRTGAGRRAAQSHTGSMAGDYEVVRAALRRAGVVVAGDTDEFFDALAAYSAYPAGLPGGGLGIVTISGGPCVAAADACEESAISAPVLQPGTQASIRALIPEFGASHNPVDMTPQMDVTKMAACVDAVARDPNVAALLAINVGLDRPEFARAFAQAKASKPVLAFTIDAPKIAEGFAAASIPMFSTPERAVRAYALLAKGPRPAPPPPESAGTPLDPLASARLLAKAGIPCCRQQVARSLAEARKLGAKWSYPVVLKALNAGPHKSRRGGVELGVTAESIAAVYRRLAAKFGPDVIVQETVDGGHEILLGARRDPTFGPVVMVGGGGVWTEMMRDIAIRIAPVDAAEARSMIAETRAGRRLGPLAAGRIAHLISTLSKWMGASSDVIEVDVNPVLVSEKRAVAVDALVIRKDGA